MSGFKLIIINYSRERKMFNKTMQTGKDTVGATAEVYDKRGRRQTRTNGNSVVGCSV